jgi:outer membrane protein TolC
MLNDLFMNAGESYVNWQNKYRVFSIYESAVELSEVRLEAVRKAFNGGDKPAIDTAEALSQLQQRQIQLSQAKIEVTQALYDLSTYLWLDSSTPVDPDKLTIKPVGDIVLNSLSALEVGNNPKLRSYQFKLQSLQIERRLKAENLRPEFNLQLGVLNGGRNPLARFSSPYQLENNKIGVQFSFPISLSTARGELAESKIKIRETELEQSMVKLELENKQRQKLPV